jgi:hypothetical protein
MMNPKRLLDGEGTEIERLLLASGRAARPSTRAKWRTGLLFFLVSIGTISKAHAVALLGAKARAFTVAHWLALGVGTGAVGWVAVHARTDAPPDPEPTVIALAPARKAAAPSSGDDARSVAPLAPDPAPPSAVEIPAPLDAHLTASPTASRSKRKAAQAGSSNPIDRSATERSIADEVEELDRARAALSTGEPKRALERLSRYDRTFPQGTLREEALRLRIEALVSAGDRATARTFAQRFRSLYPNSTHSERLKALVKEP